MNIKGLSQGLRLVAVLVLSLILVPAASARAQTASVRAYVDPPEVTVGEALTVVVEISGVRAIERVAGPRVRGFTRPGWPDYASVSVRVGGAGVPENTFVLSYEVVPNTAGSFEVGPFRITADGQDLETEAVAVTVVPRGGSEIRVEARVAPGRTRVGEAIELTVDIVGSSYGEHDFILPDVFDFAESGGGSRGRTSRTWNLRALVPGEFVIPPVRVSGPEGIFESERLTVVIDPPPVEVQAVVEAGTVWVGGEFILKLEVTGAGELDEAPVLPETGGFLELVELVDSSRTPPGRTGVAQIEHEYLFRALQAGRFEIGPVRVAAAGSALATDPIAIVVDEVPTLAEDPPTSPVMVGSPSKTRAYVNEPVIVTYAFAYDPRAEAGWPRAGTASWPSFDGFGVLKLYRGGGRRDVDAQGRTLDHLNLRRVALLPGRPGLFIVDRGIAEARTQDRFGGWNPTTGRPELTSLTLSSEPFTLEVLPLPVEGRPASFRGYVGTVSAACWVDRTRIAVGEMVTLAVEVSVEGHVETLPDPEINFPAGFTIADPEIDTTFHDNIRDLDGSRTYIYRLTAVNPGTYRIPAVEMSYFDSESESYGTARCEPSTVTVVPLERDAR
ncbi:MAG: BatD family protein [Gemmatimonadota bacterium]|nr:BatD family protein [Gemmatimonadota bacterium]